MLLKGFYTSGLHGGTVGKTVALQREATTHSQGEFARSPHACMGSLWLFQRPLTVQNMTVRLVTCPGCTLPLAHRPLEIDTSSHVTLYEIDTHEVSLTENHNSV
ncbi:hypothetical protein AMECASPLE_016643 [Ameca splendens]|uniref:Uncharacterized protein n=1 Tax=Ameca splendens TaxID=208324 RepID=A0ABV0YQD2_9TELE